MLLVREEIREAGAFVQKGAEGDFATRLDVRLVILDIVDVSKAIGSEPAISMVLINDGRVAARGQRSRSL